MEPAASLRNMVTITVDRVRLRAFHGVMPQERAVGNEFEVSVSVDIDATDAVERDCLGGTVNYAEIVALVRREMDMPSKLLEHVAGRIREALLARWPSIARGEVTVRKLTPPIAARIEGGVVVTLRF